MIQYDKAAGQFVCDFVERLPTTDTGKPFRLYRWQRETLMEFYSTMELDSESERWLRRYQYLYLEIPKKNGKSELSAALGIYHPVSYTHLDVYKRQPQYLPWGISFLDEGLTAERSDYIVIGGYPSDGKTALALSLIHISLV